MQTLDRACANHGGKSHRWLSIQVRPNTKRRPGRDWSSSLHPVAGDGLQPNVTTGPQFLGCHGDIAVLSSGGNSRQGRCEVPRMEKRSPSPWGRHSCRTEKNDVTEEARVQRATAVSDASPPCRTGRRGRRRLLLSLGPSPSSGTSVLSRQPRPAARQPHRLLQKLEMAARPFCQGPHVLGECNGVTTAAFGEGVYPPSWLPLLTALRPGGL